jgi:hypothetical protein
MLVMEPARRSSSGVIGLVIRHGVGFGEAMSPMGGLDYPSATVRKEPRLQPSTVVLGAGSEWVGGME